MNILVVDDEVIQVETITRGLISKGYEVTQAQNGDEALQKLQDEPDKIHMVITDYAMPGMNGLGLLKKIRSTHRSIPVIMMTAYGEKELVIDALRHRCDSFIEKPFTLDQLLAETERALENGYPENGNGAGSGDISHHLHQINNPLMSIIGSAEMAMLQLGDSGQVKQSIERILESAKRISDINREIMQAGLKKDDPKAGVDIHHLIEGCLDMFNDLITLKGITVEKDMGHHRINALGNPFNLEQLFKNLILNAIESMEEKAQRLLRIETFFRAYAKAIVINVIDTGCGIPEDALAKLFIPYFTSKHRGTGLGLPVVKSIVKKLNGKITVKSRVGEGTVFTVKLPAKDVGQQRARLTKGADDGFRIAAP